MRRTLVRFCSATAPARGRETLPFRRPVARLTLGAALARERMASAAIDVSDGLLQDLGHVCAASGVGAVVDPSRIPYARSLRRLSAEKRQTLAMAGGEDYELVFTVPQAHAERLARARAGHSDRLHRLDRARLERLRRRREWDHRAPYAWLRSLPTLTDLLFRFGATCDNQARLDPKRIKRLLEDVRRGARSVGGALDELRHLPYEDLGFAKVDHHRSLRQGLPEVIFAQGKTRAQIVEIAERLAAGGHDVVITRIEPTDVDALAERLPGIRYSHQGRIAWRTTPRRRPRFGRVLVISAGTADLPVAEEAAVTAECAGCEVERLYDVGVSGLHRLFDHGRRIREADVVIVVAGMEGALPSVVAGWVEQPVIAVPTSVGYGASFGGLAALLSMLNSCAAGTTVVNIDNGFGAAVAALRILRRGRRANHARR